MSHFYRTWIHVTKLYSYQPCKNVKPFTISLPRERDPTKTLILGIFLDFTRFVAEHCEKIRSPGYQLILLISPNAAIDWVGVGVWGVLRQAWRTLGIWADRPLTAPLSVFWLNTLPSLKLSSWLRFEFKAPLLILLPNVTRGSSLILKQETRIEVMFESGCGVEIGRTMMMFRFGNI